MLLRKRIARPIAYCSDSALAAREKRNRPGSAQTFSRKLIARPIAYCSDSASAAREKRNRPGSAQARELAVNAADVC